MARLLVVSGVMMNKEEAALILAARHKDIGASVQQQRGHSNGSFTGASVGFLMKLHKTREASCAIDDMQGLTPAKVRDVMRQFGDVVEESVEQGTFAAVVGAGFANMNPALVSVTIEGDGIHMTAYAKEGLVNQHTAESALSRVSAELDIMRRMRHEEPMS